VVLGRVFRKHRLVGQCAHVGPALQQWANAALAARGVRAIRLIQGVLALTRRHPRERVLAAVTEAHTHQHFRYQTIRQLVERTPVHPRDRCDFVQQLTRVDLLVLEDFGMKKLGSNAAEDLLEVFVRRHETASTLITTNRPTRDWGIFLGDVPAATAILDRFLAHATIVPLTGKSYRLRQRASATDA
jgi:hypothetical protein